MYKKHAAQLFEKTLHDNDDFINTKNQVNQYYQLLKNNLSKDDIKILDKLMNCNQRKEAIKSTCFFKNGFDLGLNTAAIAYE